VRRLIAFAVVAGCLAAPSGAAARSPSLDFRVVDIGSVVAFDVDLCSRELSTVRFQADFIQGGRTFRWSRWRRETQGQGCARLFLGVPDTRARFAPGMVDARLRILTSGARRASATRWFRFYVQ
jgi:hypothetical protein